MPEEYKANLRKNVADAIGILSKLTTGIDVNVRFHDVKGFEFTDEIAIFDLMDISLVHGWLVDPQVRFCLCISAPDNRRHLIRHIFGQAVMVHQQNRP